MCNAWGLGSLHVFMIVSGVLCILLALGGQAYGCVSPTLEPGYVCSDYEASLYLSNKAVICGRRRYGRFSFS